MTQRLSIPQRRVLDYIMGYITDHGFAPSIRDIAAGTGRASTTIHFALGQLERKGRITRAPRIPRSICIVQQEWGNE